MCIFILCYSLRYCRITLLCSGIFCTCVPKAALPKGRPWKAAVRASLETESSPASEKGIFQCYTLAYFPGACADNAVGIISRGGVCPMRFSKKGILTALLLAACVLCFGTAASAKAPVLRMATTTSTADTGLLDYLAPIFLKDTGVDLQWVAVGTGKALQFGRNGDVDIVLTHDPKAEDKFMEDGAGANRRKVMYNDFVLIGPANDPAGIKGKPIKEALATIAKKGAPLVSRADKSGTHSKELALLKAAGVKDFDKAKWYVQTGQGMLKTINVADEQKGYALTDRGTFIKYQAGLKGKPGLVIVNEGDPELLNKYSVMAVNPLKHSEAKYNLALKFIDWITSSKVQKEIADFKLEGKQLFFPEAEIRSGH